MQADAESNSLIAAIGRVTVQGPSIFEALKNSTAGRPAPPDCAPLTVSRG